MSEVNLSIPFSVGTCVTDPTSNKAYKLLEMLGIGTFAVVYRVTEAAARLEEERHYALKCLSKKLLDERQCETQRNECRLHKSVGRHPRVVEFVNSFENEEWLFLLVEYVPGVDLFAWLSGNCDKARPEHDEKVVIEEGNHVRNVLRIFLQMLDAVAYVHSKGVFHRDLKPENFMINLRTLDVKLIDFGLGTTDECAAEWECGSKPYMSYECRNELGKFYSARKADIWSLGIVLLNLLTYKCPWADAHPRCPEFARYVEEREYYLATRFGCPEKVAEFLANRVFTERDADRCSLTSMRIWADRLADDLPASLGYAVKSTSSPFGASTAETLCGAGDNRASLWSESPTECGDDMAEEAVFHFDDHHRKTASPLARMCNRPSEAETLFSSPPTNPSPFKMACPVPIPALTKCIPWSEWDDDEEIDFTLAANNWFLPNFNEAPPQNQCSIEDAGIAGSTRHGTLVELAPSACFGRS